MKKAACYAAAFLFCSLVCGAARAKPLGLRDAVLTALVHNPEIAAADQDTAVLRTKVRQIKSLGRLQLNLESSYIHLDEAPSLKVDLGPYLKPAFNAVMQSVPNMWPAPAPPALTNPPTVPPSAITGYANPFKTAVTQALNAADFSLAYPLSKQDMTRHTLVLQWPLYTGGRVVYGALAAKNAIAATDEKAQTKRNEIVFTVVKAYFSVVLAQCAAQVNAEAYDNIKTHVDQAEKLYKQGVIAKYEFMRAQTELANQDRRRLDAQNQADLAMAYLKDLMGVPESETPTLTDSLNGTEKFAMDMEAAIKAAVDSSNDLKALQYRDRLYYYSEKAARAERLPTIAAVASKDLRTEDLSIMTPGAFVGVVLKMPIIDNGSAKAKAAEQAMLRDRNATDITRLKNGLRLMVTQNYLDLTSARKALEAADKAVELATESHRLAEKRFEAGQGTGMEVTDSVLALSIAETNREQSRYQYDIAYYGLLKAIGSIQDEFQTPGGTGK